MAASIASRWSQSRGLAGGSAALVMSAIPGPCCSFDGLTVPQASGGSAGADAALQDVSAQDVASEPSPDSWPDAPSEDEGAEVDAPGCAQDLADCDKSPDNGCETSLLTDGLHCGTCERSCLGGTCTAGRCDPIALATGQPQALGIALDDTHVYWTCSTAQGSVHRISKAGGEPATIATGQDHPFGIAVDDTTAYWASYSVNGAMIRHAKDGAPEAGTPSVLVGLQDRPQVVAVYEDRVYWTTPGAVRRIQKDGGGLESLGNDQGSTGGLAIDFTGVYWTSPTNNRIMHGELGPDAGSDVFLPGQCGPTGIALDYGSVYFTDYLCGAAGQSVLSIAKANMQEPVVIAAAQAGPIGLAVDLSHVYWTNNTGQQVMKAPKTGSGGPVTVLAEGQEGAFGIAVDADHVYWTCQSAGTVMKVAK